MRGDGEAVVKYILFYGIGFGLISLFLFWCLAALSLDLVMLVLQFAMPGVIIGTGYGVVRALSEGHGRGEGT